MGAPKGITFGENSKQVLHYLIRPAKAPPNCIIWCISSGRFDDPVGLRSVIEFTPSGNTWRTVYTVRFRDVVYVLHAFQKKSKSGTATPKAEIDLIHQRLAAAERHYKEGQS
jgi:hypothetical protein